MTDFTLDVLAWDPRLEPVDPAGASAEQRAALERSGKLDAASPYFRTLAHDPASLVHRSLLYDEVMYAEHGLDRTERELAALATSMVNGCRYCASVHGRRLGQLTGDRPGVRAYLAGDQAFATDPRRSAIVAAARALTAAPARLGPEHVTALRAAGLDELEIFDALDVTALFAWANRLMQLLGDSRASGRPESQIVVDPGRTTPAAPGA
ncbi:MAG TPA: peroxidase-related enzyme [Cellulomonas sp.]